MNLQLKLKFYYDHVLSTVYDEGESPIHKNVTADIITRFIDPLAIAKDSKILDLGCGPGYFLDEMRSRGYTDLTGVTLSRKDVEKCQSKGHVVRHGDMNFLPDADSSIDFLFCRHSLEHSPFPYITLLEYNRVLKPNGTLYIEVPSPDCEQPHEENRNHYSILTKKMWLALLNRTGFGGAWYEYEFPVNFLDERASQGPKKEVYYIFTCRRERPVDIK